ncbi:polysaccharide pyruvyl transferase family protein [Alistipes sp.]|uniref:polysaccharide pyruvyl transferase family protein n=1 Tax=Alistipes sp. TaxID=1872444 RepID=UPI003AF002A7
MNTYREHGVSKLATKTVNLIREILGDPIIVNAFVYQHFGRVVHRNWGDDINYFFLRTITGRKIVVYDYSSLAHRLHKVNYMAIGSSLTLLCNDRTVVWGAGVIDPRQELPAKPLRVEAVRGPLTRQYLLDRRIDCPEVYGDPALLLPSYYRPKTVKRYKLGVIPHYADYGSPLLERLKNDPEVLVIRTEQYDHWHDFPDQICSCEAIASSSLHGLIVAEAYGIPNLWIEVSDAILGGHFKYHDFFLSIGRDRNIPYKISGKPQKEELLIELQRWQAGSIDTRQLKEHCPFRLLKSE